MAHTKGPFSVHPYSTPPWQNVPAGPGNSAFRAASITLGQGRKIVGHVVAQTPWAGFPSVEDEAELLANAALFIAAPDMLEALKAAKQFITNGVEFGYIRMPDPETPDSAHATLPMIEAAIAKAGDAASVEAVTEAMRSDAA